MSDSQPTAGLFAFIDQVRALIESPVWSSVLMDLSKNDAFALLQLYRGGGQTMSQLAEHLGVPANTVTGVVNRLAAKDLVVRSHSQTDRRIVEIEITEAGTDAVTAALRQFARYEALILAELEPAEIRVLMGVVDKVIGVLRDDMAQSQTRAPSARRIPIE